MWVCCREQRREKKKEKRSKRDNEGAAQASTSTGANFNAGITAEDLHMMQQLGLPLGFATTQGELVHDAAANDSAVKITSQRKARQFMNRKGGFNRSLPAEQTGKKMQEA